MFDPSRLAVEAHRLSGPQRDAFVRRHCGADPVKHAELANKLAELEELCATLPPGAADSDPSETVDPGRTLISESDSSDALSFDQKDGQTADQLTIDGGVANDLKLDDRLRAEAILDGFESDCSNAELPNWILYIPADANDALKRYLAHHLVLLDLAYRDERKLPIDLESYVSRLPEFQREIQAAITLRSQRSRSPTVRRGRNDSDIHSNAMAGWQQRANRSTSMRYVPGQMHAKGGLGAVYRGRDTELGRTVALKRILPKYENVQECRDRFVFEAEVTGSLEHPGIVPIYGLSTCEDGKPYYAMRFIRGRSFGDAIRKFHKENSPLAAGAFDSRAFRGLLRRLIECCNAMHYAHERRILHRDLKPDNIMLGQYGETLVVDWGLAMVMPRIDAPPNESKTDEDTLPFPSAGSQLREGTTVGTPSYMSPEQAKGVQQFLTPATDIYALGAILFRITTNQLCVEGQSLLEVVANVREGNLRDLNQALPVAPRPLASICRRALAYSPTERYATAIELADDIDRWMNDEKVLAHAEFETAREKAGRMIRRYRSWTLSTAVALVAVTVITLVASIFIQQAKAREELAKLRATQFKGEAISRYRQSREAIDTWLVQSNDALQYFPGTRSVRSRLLELAAEDYARLADGSSDDPELELERLRAMLRQGDLLLAAEQPQAAREIYSKAMSGLEQPRGDLDIERFAADAAHVHSRIGLSWAAEGQIDSARESYAAAVGKLRNLLSENDSEDAADEQEINRRLRYLAAAEINAGELELQVNDFERSRQSLQAGITALGRLGKQTLPKDELTKSQAMDLIGRMDLSLGNRQAAAKQFEGAARIVRGLVHSEPDQPEFLDALGSLMVSQASVDRGLGQSEREEASLREAVDAYRSLHRAIPDMPAYQEKLALTLTDLGIALHDAHRSGDARAILAESLTLLESLTRSYGNSMRYVDTTAATHDVLGQVLLDMGETADSQSHLIESLTAYQSLSETYPDRPDFYERLAIAQSHLSRAVAEESPENASTGFAAATAILTQLADQFPDVPSYRASLAHVAYHQGRFLATQDLEAAREAFEVAVQYWKELADQHDSAACERLAWLLATSPLKSICDETQACELAAQAVSLVPESEAFRSTLALSQVAANQIDAATKTISSLLDEKAFPSLGGRAWWAIAAVRQSQGQPSEAAQAIATAEAWYVDQASRHAELQTWRKWAGSHVDKY
ncbi:serine/threonine-protein kinase [Aporhodopirellula aestuarii]|uniref:Serine/threonine protein kinase n=1 Tax=Aporhodopirellula aestuarii TaxID=2950107 RepID=A0ABT0U9P0_9BACT|nr:serine/threonine-protein kinase [Aporhodopirellula aestuarii]MCM2373699.1 serine/threonine protein kinase [Aporhodopirellula aestuarii]